MADRRLLNQKRLTATDLGLDGVTLAAERTSNAFPIEGYNHISVFVNFTHNAATRIDVNIDHSPLYISETPVWHELPISSTSSTGVATVTELDAQRAVSGDKKYTVKVGGLNGVAGRIRISGTSGGASDLVTVYAILAYGPL